MKTETVLLSSVLFSLHVIISHAFHSSKSTIGINSSTFLEQEYRPQNNRLQSTSLECQILGMNCATPTDFSFSWKGFARRGGDTDVHCHGWGITFYEGRGIRSFHDPNPACDSPIADLVENYPMKTYNMVSRKEKVILYLVSFFNSSCSSIMLDGTYSLCYPRRSLSRECAPIYKRDVGDTIL